ncbi:MAG: nitrite reductase small subunit NirD [Propionibacteriales bacterium]|nr:nitrite reductase small subunit NirD [Propionibacteriales bacterium]
MSRWVPVCRYDQLEVERGSAALVEGEQIALYRLPDGSVHALHNRDPFSRAYVMARGIVGSFGGTPYVASPMHKQGFSLATGQCLDDAETAVKVYPVRISDGVVHVAWEGSP